MKNKQKNLLKNCCTIRNYFYNYLKSFRNPDLTQMIILGAIIGIVGGLGAVIFYRLIAFFKNLFFTPSTTDTFLDVVRSLPWYHRILAPTIGGLIIGPLITFFVKEAKGHGVPEVMEAVALKSGVIRPRVAPFKAIISAICIGSGGAAGREGPIVQIGSSFGSFIGQFLKLKPAKVETLLAAGAAAGIAGTFNAPLAGLVFSMEVLLKNIKLDSFSPIVVASVVGTAVANVFLGPRGAIFDIPPHVFVSFWEIIPYILLGFAAAGVALLFSNSLYATEHFFSKFSIPDYLKPAIGGLLLGLLALYVPQIHATGYPVMNQALRATLPFQVVFALMFAKILATNLTLGSGGSGGIFAPSLFIGSMLGSSFGKVVHFLFPTITAGATSYASIGMGAVFAGATHAPLSAIIIIFEMTRDTYIIMPLMFTCILSTLITSRVQKKNIYTTKLLNRGVDLTKIEKETILSNILVQQIMATDLITIYKTTTVQEAKKVFDNTLLSYIPIVEKGSNKFAGLLNHISIFKELEENPNSKIIVKDLMFQAPGIVFENETLLKTLDVMHESNMKVIPVLDDIVSRKLIGIINRGDVIEAYHQKISIEEQEKEEQLVNKTFVNLNDLIKNAINIFGIQLKDRNINLKLNILDNLPEIKVDKTKINWVLVNLLGNAIRHTDNGGEIEVKSYAAEGWLYISVKDSGKGMDEEIQRKLFAENNNNSGMGLSICREIIEQHKGKIWVDSTIGKGTKFTFILKLTIQ